VAPQSMKAHIAKAADFLAALDQSGRSTPGALRLYGIPESAYTGEVEMFARMHEMRVRVMTTTAFTDDKVIGATLFEGTMDGEVQAKPAPSYLWEDRECVRFLKVDKGLKAESDGVSLMRPIPELDTLLDRAVKLGVFGTKMRSTINLPSKSSIAAIAKQQFEISPQIAKHGLVPILEPEVLIKSPGKPNAEALLKDALARHLSDTSIYPWKEVVGAAVAHLQAMNAVLRPLLRDRTRAALGVLLSQLRDGKTAPIDKKS
jgi:fructose-bisphosphate aldolase class I